MFAMNYLALEAGITWAKAMLYGEEKGVMDTEAAEYGPDIAGPGTIRADEAVDAVLACGARLLARHPGIPIEAVGLSSIWQSFLLLDDSGRPVSRIFTREDKSPAPTVEKYRRDSTLTYRFYKSTGCPVSGVFDLWKWMHFKESGDVSQAAALSNLPGYLYLRLTGKRQLSFITASGGGMMSLSALRWDDNILNFTGIAKGMLPELVTPQTTAGLGAEAAAILKLAPGIPVTVTNADGALSHIAAGGLGKKVMTVSVGTSGAIRFAVERPLIPPVPSTFCCFGGEGTYILGASTSGAGSCVEWFARGIYPGAADYARLEKLAGKAAREHAPYFLPFLYGEEAPGWMDGRQGGFYGLSPRHGRAEMYYAVLEGTLFNLYQNYLVLQKFDSFQPGSISVSGGITGSPFWMQLAADIFGSGIHENAGRHASLLGAAYMAQYASGHIESLKSITAGEGKMYSPGTASHARLMERYSRWLEYYEEGKGN